MTSEKTVPDMLSLDEASTQFLAHCRFSKNLSDHTIRAYAADLAEFRAFFGAERPVAECTRAVLRGYLQHLFEARKLKETSIKRRIACLKVMFRWLESDEVLPITPFHRLNATIRLPKRLPRALSPHEVLALRTAPAQALGLRGPGGYTRKRLQQAVDESTINFSAPP